MDLSRFEWNGYAINHAISRNQGASTTHKGNVLFVHGFGASIGHWKKNMPALIDAGFKVHAIDLLGFGRSDKPADFTYSMEAWRDLLMAYVDAFVPSGESVVLVGNSIGSLASVLTAASLPPERVRGLVLVNCAGGMNNTAILDDDWRIRAVYPIILAINALLKIKPVGRFLFDKFRSRENVRGVLASVYCNPAAVDDALVDLIYEPSNDEGALETFVRCVPRRTDAPDANTTPHTRQADIALPFLPFPSFPSSLFFFILHSRVLSFSFSFPFLSASLRATPAPGPSHWCRRSPRPSSWCGAIKTPSRPSTAPWGASSRPSPMNGRTRRWRS